MRFSYDGEGEGMFAGLVQFAVTVILIAVAIILLTSYALTRYGHRQRRARTEAARRETGEPASRWGEYERIPRGMWAPVFGLPVAALFFRNTYEVSGDAGLSFGVGGIGWIGTILVIVLLFDTYELSAFKRWSIVWHISSVVALWSLFVQCRCA
jgi:hypothetical protein